MRIYYRSISRGPSSKVSELLLKKRAVAGLAAMTIIATACSSSQAGTGTAGSTTAHRSSSTAPSSSPATGTATTPAPSPSATPLAQADLAQIVVQQSDLPAGWTGTPHEADPNDAADQAALVQCVGGKNTSADKVVEANSPDFSLSQSTVDSSATSYKSQSDVAADTALINSPQISSCYEQLLKAQLATSLPAGGKLGAVSITITPGSGGGPPNIVGLGTGSVTATVSGQPLTIYLAVAFITGHLLEAEVDVESVGQAIPVSLFSSVVTAVAARAAQH